jgi:hypothetical protein
MAADIPANLFPACILVIPAAVASADDRFLYNHP